ncbi:MAG: sensor histidine kinase [Magnetospirillum sp.]|nr:sensor histidine kinase [Magnetospirillum sp.]
MTSNAIAPSSPIPTRPKARVGSALAVAVLVGVLLVGWVHDRARTEALNESMAIGRQRLGLYAATTRSAVERFSYLPSTIALDGQMIELLAQTDPSRMDAANRKLETINAKAGSAALYIMNAKGLTVAASNWRTDTSYVGNDYSFRPYFAEAMETGSGRLFGIGVTTKLPGYFLAAAVRDAVGKALGAVVVKVDLETLESDWGQSDDAVMVTDQDGVVILTSRPSWKYAIDGPITPELRQRLDTSQRYGAIPIRPLMRRQSRLLGDSVWMERTDGTTYVAQSEALPEEGWTIHYLVDWDAMERRVNTTAALAGIGWIAAILLVLYLRQRRIALQSKLDAREAMAVALRRARDDLERLVAQRTLALSDEIVEHQRTERHLRATQDELIHAGKMAALGQMSAAIAHELNQPLAAIQTFVASTRMFLARGDLPVVEQNLSMIDDLGKRMAEIIRHLRVFARKSPTSSQPVDPAAGIARALILLEPRLRQAEIEVAAPSPEGFMVNGDPGRLEQVFVNLFANAIDAMADSPIRRLSVRVAGDGETVSVKIRDSGPGLPPEALDRAFEPFFTTKEVGEGLGLGLSLSYGIIRDMGGSIRAENGEGGGAVFTLALPACHP